MSLVGQILSLFAYAFVVALGIGALAVLVVYVIDKTQTKHAIRRNFPVIGRFRYLFEQIKGRCPGDAAARDLGDMSFQIK